MNISCNRHRLKVRHVDGYHGDLVRSHMMMDDIMDMLKVVYAMDLVNIRITMEIISS